MQTTDAKIVAKARVKIRRVEIFLKDTQMLQAPMIPTTSADPNVAILKNHSILSDLFIFSHLARMFVPKFQAGIMSCDILLGSG